VRRKDAFFFNGLTLRSCAGVWEGEVGNASGTDASLWNQRFSIQSINVGEIIGLHLSKSNSKAPFGLAEDRSIPDRNRFCL
jgi:hypothetical protein